MEENNKNQLETKANKDASIYRDTKDTNVGAQFSYFQFLSHKSQKLSTALYLFSNFFDQNEPLRFSLRQLGIRLLSLTLSLKNVAARERQTQGKFVIATVEEISALCHVAASSGMISEMNHTILQRELKIFLNELDISRMNKEEEKIVIPSHFFESDALKEPSKNLSYFDGQNMFDQDNIKRAMGPVSKTKDPVPSFYKGQYKRHYDVKDSTPIDSSFKNQDKRKELIIKAFKDARLTFMTIKDFSTYIKDCSEKTIQRQLLDLVKDGVLKKDGERRWSRYSLKANL